jgi:hypothetical protein
MRIQDHRLASRLPNATDGPSTHLVSEDFRPFIARPNFPTLDQSIRRNEPQISLHVTSFKDATLVALSWPHVLMDASAGEALLSGWSSVLTGRERDIVVVTGAQDDILLQAAMSKKAETSEKFKLEKNRLTGVGLLIFQLRCLWDKFWILLYNSELYSYLRPFSINSKLRFARKLQKAARMCHLSAKAKY